ncbi:UNKNOWN [Stylonychia lemnae]|uniref:Uncharacterized protein n=1 Tax=Stylonychia lemnae TaxID=5949 RepID=A0A077ZXG7_STYLE|nr:UNKNOWN [Stylonychia lemnae]|eukprot:CDW73922.1 UNKNOWN [Stylonychia lemnae]
MLKENPINKLLSKNIMIKSKEQLGNGITSKQLIESHGMSTDRSTALGEYSNQQKFQALSMSNNKNQVFPPTKNSTSSKNSKLIVPSFQFQEQMTKYIPVQESTQKTFDFNFLSHRSGMKSFYKNKNYKVITQDGDLVLNQSKALIEKSKRLPSVDLQKSKNNNQQAIIDGIVANEQLLKNGQLDDEFDPLFQASKMISFQESERKTQDFFKSEPITVREDKRISMFSPLYNENIDYEYKQIKYVKLVPKKFKENYEIHFQDVFKKGQIYNVFEDQKDINLRKKKEQQQMIQNLQKTGISCISSTNRKCSNKKHFDIVDVENLAFSNLYIESQNLVDGQPVFTQQPKTSIVKVSRYPRATLPPELKNRFEINVQQQIRGISTDKGANLQNTRGQTAISIYDNLYNDQFWRQPDSNEALKDKNGLPFFQTFRPETCYKWSSPSVQQEKSKTTPGGTRTSSMFQQYNQSQVQEVEVNQDDLRALSQMGNMRTIEKNLWKFGGFIERPEWFDKMIMMASHQKRRCKCCNRFNCLKYLRQKTEFKEPSQRLRASTVVGSRLEEIKLIKTSRLDQAKPDSYQDIIQPQLNQIHEQHQINVINQQHQIFLQSLNKPTLQTTQDQTTKAQVGSAIVEIRNSQNSQSSLDSNKIVNINDPIITSESPKTLQNDQINPQQNQPANGQVLSEVDTLDYLTNHRRSVTYQYQQDMVRQTSTNPKLESIGSSSQRQYDIFQPPSHRLNHQESYDDLNQKFNTEQNHLNSYKVIEQLLQKAHNQVKSWDASNEGDSIEDYAQVPISQTELKNNIKKSSERDKFARTFRPINTMTLNKNSKNTYGYNTNQMAQSTNVSPVRNSDFAKSIFKHYKVPLNALPQQQQKWTSPFQQRAQKEQGKKTYLSINKAINMDRPKNQISTMENNAIAPGYISRRDFKQHKEQRRTVAIHDPSLQYFHNREHYDHENDQKRLRTYHVYGPFSHKIDESTNHDNQDKFSVNGLVNKDQNNDSLYQLHNIDIDPNAQVDYMHLNDQQLFSFQNQQNIQQQKPPVEEVEFQNQLLKESCS